MNQHLVTNPILRLVATAANVAVVSLVVVAAGGCKPTTEAAPPREAVPVVVATPITRQVQNYEEATGRVAAKYAVEIRSRVTGYLSQINFVDGADVKTTDPKPLFVIDQRPFKAAYDAALAKVDLSKANLAFRKAEHERNQTLIKTAAVSQSEFDKSAASFEQARAMIAEAEAEAESAKLNLEFTEIKAPIDGRIGKALIDQGNLVLADQTLLTTIVSVDPITVNFDVDERRLLRIQQMVRDGKIPVAEADRIPVEMGLDNEPGYPHRGEIDFSDNQLDPATGTIQMRGEFANPLPKVGKRVLVPGMFARLRVPIGNSESAVLIAEQAIGSDQGQKFVYVIDGEGKVQYRRIKTGRSESGLRVVEEGVKAGDQVMVSGLQRVRPGVTVKASTVDMNSFTNTGEAAKESPSLASPTATATASSTQPKPTSTSEPKP